MKINGEAIFMRNILCSFVFIHLIFDDKMRGGAPPLLSSFIFVVDLLVKTYFSMIREHVLILSSKAPKAPPILNWT